MCTALMLDTGAHLRAGRVGGLLRLTEFAIATGAAMNTALQAAVGELFLDLSAAIGAVGPHVRSMSYTSGSHTVFHHRYHIVWITKYRYKVLEGALRERIRTIIRQLCKELGVQIVSGVLSREHVHMFVEIPPHIAVSDFVRRVKGRSSHQVQMEFPDLRKRYWGRHFWARGYFSTT